MAIFGSATEAPDVGVRQFANSVASILRNRHIDRHRAIARHMRWQYLKALDRFPLEQPFSRSRIIAAHRRCGVSALINSQGLYDYDNMNLLHLMLADGGTYFDVGANIGSYTLLASEHPLVRAVAFEPHPKTCALLRANVDLNRRANVLVVNAALGSRDALMALTDAAGSAVNHRVADGSPNSIPVQCLRADTFCAAHGLQPRFVKLDVEGFEHDVLVGFGDYLRAVDLLLIEMNGLSDARAVSHAETHALLIANDLRGPFRFEFDTRSFYPNDGPAAQDSVYLSARLFDHLDRWGLASAGHS
jgi:FkbM family methyltransferase